MRALNNTDSGPCPEQRNAIKIKGLDVVFFREAKKQVTQGTAGRTSAAGEF